MRCNERTGLSETEPKAFEKIKPGGILFTFSCSQVVTKDNFRTAVFTAAAMSGRSVRILHQLTQPADHPVNIYHPEGEYLKGLVLSCRISPARCRNQISIRRIKRIL